MPATSADDATRIQRCSRPGGGRIEGTPPVIQSGCKVPRTCSTTRAGHAQPLAIAIKMVRGAHAGAITPPRAGQPPRQRDVACRLRGRTNCFPTQRACACWPPSPRPSRICRHPRASQTPIGLVARLGRGALGRIPPPPARRAARVRYGYARLVANLSFEFHAAATSSEVSFTCITSPAEKLSGARAELGWPDPARQRA